MTHDPGATGTMILLFSVALATAPAYPSRVLPPAPQVSGPAGGLQGSGRRAAYLHQLAGEEEQGVQCAGEGCQPHLTLGLSCCPAPERDLPPHLAIFTNVNTPPPFCFVNEKENPVTVCLPCPLLPEPTLGAHGPGGHGAGGLGLSWPLGRGPPQAQSHPARWGCSLRQPRRPLTSSVVSLWGDSGYLPRGGREGAELLLTRARPGEGAAGCSPFCIWVQPQYRAQEGLTCFHSDPCFLPKRLLWKLSRREVWPVGPLSYPHSGPELGLTPEDRPSKWCSR